jgi:hypothetical protein
LSTAFPAGRRSKNIIGTQLIIGRFGFSCLPAGRRLPFSVPKREGNKATGIISEIHTEKSIFPSFREVV